MRPGWMMESADHAGPGRREWWRRRDGRRGRGGDWGESRGQPGTKGSRRRRGNQNGPAILLWANAPESLDPSPAGRPQVVILPCNFLFRAL